MDLTKNPRRINKLDNEYDESGLLGLAFHPKDKKRFFIFYTTSDKRYRTIAPPDVEDRLYFVPKDMGGELGLVVRNIADLDGLPISFEVEGEKEPLPKPVFWQVVSEFEIGRNGKPKMSSERVLFGIPQYWETHNSGKIAFGPDGYLYITTADGGPNGDPRNNSQNLASLEGKILRIDVNKKNGPGGRRYGIPKSNPFVKNKKAAPEVYAFGLRNAWGLAWDTKKRLWTVDVGDADEGWEGVEIIKAGGNYGWRLREGTHRSEWGNLKLDATNKKFIPPVYEYAYTEGGAAIGGYPKTKDGIDNANNMLQVAIDNISDPYKMAEMRNLINDSIPHRRAILSVICTGYAFYLVHRTYNKLTANTEANISTIISNIITDKGDFVASTSVETNTQQSNQFYNDDEMSW
ncbi:hypothetical protein LCGC14_2209630, partial [marine sediment metagenome]